MKVRNTSYSTSYAGAAPAKPVDPVDATTATARAGRRAGGPAGDVATVMGIPEAELTPKVRIAIAELMAEVQRLRDELGQSAKRVGYLEELADQDPLTPVLNRRAFVREMSRMISFAERYHGVSSVLYFDLNAMKEINDRHGHAAGDAALGHVAQVLLRNVRASDVVGRLGGDEFGVLLAQADSQTALAKAQSLAKAIQETTVDTNGSSFFVMVSHGAHTFAAGEEVDAVLDAADRAMYENKKSGRAAAGEE